MDAFKFIKDCQTACKNGKAIRDSFQPKKGKEKRKHAKVGFPEYGFSSVPGEHFGHAPGPAASTHPVVLGTSTVGTSGPVADIGMGSGGLSGDGSPAGEAVEKFGVEAVLESFEKENPSSDIVPEIRRLFENVKKGNGVLYHSCDGVATPRTESANPSPIDESQVSALAASCESALNAFKNYTGFDYEAIRR